MLENYALKTYLKRFGVVPVVVGAADVADVAPVEVVLGDADVAVVVDDGDDPHGFGKGDVFSAPRCGFSLTVLDSANENFNFTVQNCMELLHHNVNGKLKVAL